MTLGRCLTMALLAAVTIGMSAQSARALTFAGTPTDVRASTQFSGSFSPDRLFDGPITPADIGTLGPFGTDYAGSGNGPHTIYTEYGSSFKTDGFVFAQRLGGNPAVDKVSKIELWFENSSALPLVTGSGFGPPVRAPDETITPLNTTSVLLTQYALTTSYDAEFVYMRVTDNGGNPGGNEFRFILAPPVPEPATAGLSLLGLAALGLAGPRRPRRV